MKRVTEWLATAEGLGKAVVAFLGVPALLWAGVTKFLDPLGLPKAVIASGAASVLLVIAILLWISFRKYAGASRLEQPDAFTVHATSPSSLVGRVDDLDRLVKSVKQSRLVLLDGESGCGKSALVCAGLIPELRLSTSGLLPIAIRDWGENWMRGPLSAALDALFQSVTSSEAEKLGWISSPDLAADIPELARDLDERLRAVLSVLGRRPLLIADQFDDHQARHRHRFLDEEKNWLSPGVLARSNEFWRVVSRAVAERRLHLLVVTRADTAAGLACVRFLGDDQTVSRTLPRVETEYLRPLLANIAADDAKPPVVSNPARGWHELRECLENDLKVEGAVLMQQVRTVLLGVRQLALLTPAYYRRAGGLRGVETLVISRALRRAGEAAGGGDAGSRTARALLARLILTGGPNQPPKAQRASLSVLSEVAGSTQRAEAMLALLQQDEIVRPAEAAGDSGAWQLDHDYLARAVIAEAQQSDRWSMTLREGKARYEAARGWRRRWGALLSTRALARVCWERSRNRLRFGNAVDYARISAMRPIAAVLVLVAAAFVAEIGRRQANVVMQSFVITASFGTEHEQDAVLQTWQASDAVRQRVYASVLSDSASPADDRRFKGALASLWPAAHAGLEPARAKEAADLLRIQLLRERDSSLVGRLSYVYGAVASRLSDADAKNSAGFLLAKLGKERDPQVAISLAKAYGAVTARPGADSDVRSALAVLRALLQRDDGEPIDFYAVTSTYAILAARLKAVDAKAEAASLRADLNKEPEDFVVMRLAKAYEIVALRLSDADAAAETDILLVQLQANESDFESGGWVTVYAAAAARLKQAAGLEASAAFLRAHLVKKEKYDYFSRQNTALAYATVATHLSAADAKTEADALRAMLQERALEVMYEPSLLVAYSTVASRLDDPVEVRGAAAFLRSWLERALTANAEMVAKSGLKPRKRRLTHEPISNKFVQAYRNITARLDELGAKGEAAVLYGRLQQERNPESSAVLAQAYAVVAPNLGELSAQKTASALLRERLEQGLDGDTASVFALAYAKLVARQNEPAEFKPAAALLRSRLVQEAVASIAQRSTSLEWNTRLLIDERQPIDDFVQAYATVAERLPEADVKLEAAILRARIGMKADARIAGYLALPYATVASRLNDVSDLKAAANFFRRKLEQESYSAFLEQNIQAYAKVMEALLLRANPDGRSALIAEILSTAGHPYLDERTVLLKLLRSTAKKDFGNDVAAAVAWAETSHAFAPSQLRPRQMPLDIIDQNKDRPAAKKPGS